MSDLMQYIRNVYVDAVSFWRRQNAVEIPKDGTDVLAEIEQIADDAQKPVPQLHELTVRLIEEEREKVLNTRFLIKLPLTVASLKRLEGIVDEAASSAVNSVMFDVFGEMAIQPTSARIESKRKKLELGKKKIRDQFGVTYEKVPAAVLQSGKDAYEKLRRIPDVLTELKRRRKYLDKVVDYRLAFELECIKYIEGKTEKRELAAAGNQFEEAYRAAHRPMLVVNQPAVSTYPSRAPEKQKRKAPTNGAPSTYDLLTKMGVHDGQARQFLLDQPGTLELNVSVLEDIAGKERTEQIVCANPAYFVREVIDPAYERALRAAVSKGDVPIGKMASPKDIGRIR